MKFNEEVKILLEDTINFLDGIDLVFEKKLDRLVKELYDAAEIFQQTGYAETPKDWLILKFEEMKHKTPKELEEIFGMKFDFATTRQFRDVMDKMIEALKKGISNVVKFPKIDEEASFAQLGTAPTPNACYKKKKKDIKTITKELNEAVEGALNEFDNEPIQIFTPASKEYKKLQDFADDLNKELNDINVTVKTIYFDYGQGWKWTTLVASKTAVKSITDSVQLVSPTQQRKILWGTPEEVEEVKNNRLNWLLKNMQD